MSPLSLLCLLALFSVTIAKVVELDDGSFDRVAASGPLFVKVYAPWCGHCKVRTLHFGFVLSQALYWHPVCLNAHFQLY